MNEGSVSAQDHVDIKNLYARYNLMSDAGAPHSRLGRPRRTSNRRETAPSLLADARKTIRGTAR